MNKTDILDHLPKLSFTERTEIFSFLWDLEEKDLPSNESPSAEEKYLLDKALEEYQANPNAGSPWHEVKSRILLKI